MGKSMFIYPWDIMDGGIVKTLTDIKEMGMTDISLSVSYHSGKLLLPHNPRKKIYYHSSGRIYYRPNIQEYKKLKPIVGEAYEEYQDQCTSADQGDLLSRIIDEAKKLEMGVRAWVVGFHNSRLGKEYPQYTVRNVYNEPYYHALCPTHEESQHYVLQMIQDLAVQYDLSGIELESFDYLGCLHGDHHEIVGIEDKLSLEKLLGLCFCSECEKLAEKQGVDVPALKHQVRKSVEQIANLNKMVEPIRKEELTPFLGMRSGVVENIFRKIRKIIDDSQNNIPLYNILWMAHGADPINCGTVPEKLSPYVNGWIACYPEKVEDVATFISRVKTLISEDKLIAGVRLIEPQTTESDHVSGYLEKYETLGIHDINFYNYGLTPRCILNKLKDTEYPPASGKRNEN